MAVELVAARTPEDKLLWAFRQYDTDNSGHVDRNEMINVITSIYSMLDVIGQSPKAYRTISTLSLNLRKKYS